MKRFLMNFASVLALGLCILTSCNREDLSNKTSLELSVSVPEDLELAFNGTAKLVSIDGNFTYEVTVVDGKARFDKIYIGLYNLSVQMETKLGEKDILVVGSLKNIEVVKAEEIGTVSVETEWSYKSSLVISRIYCNGTKKNNGKIMNMPKYYEIFNNTDAVQYLDGLCIALAHGNTTSTNPCALYQAYKDTTFCYGIVRIPGKQGDNKVALQPGKSCVIAWNASNFIIPEDTAEGAGDKCTMNCDLTGADFEIESAATSWKNYGDNVNVPNLTEVFCVNPNAGFNSMNQAVLIFYATEEEIAQWKTAADESSYTISSQKLWMAKAVCNSIILDAVETVKAGDSTKQQKRIPDVLDASFVEAGNNLGVVFNRKLQYLAEDGRMVLQDTNNSANDFVVTESKDSENYDGSHLAIRNYSYAE